MKITLICSDDDYWALGLRSISSALKAQDHQTRLILTNSSGKPLGRRVLEEIYSLSRHSELIGISSMSRSSERAKKIIKSLRPLNKPIVWGGMHPTLYPKDCVGHVDLICRGEGEEFMIELAERLSKGRDFRDIASGGYTIDGHVILNDIRPLSEKLDELPLVDFSFSNEFYMNNTKTIRTHPRMSPSTSMLISGSRGCICNCHYCSNSQIKLLYAGKGRFARKMSAHRLVEAAEAYLDKFPRARYVFFTDEDFLSRTVDQIAEFANVYPKRVGLPFQCLASPQMITEEKMALLVKAGLLRIDIGVESGSERIKKEIYNRPISNEIVKRAASIINQYPQVIAFYFFIIGNPYESRRDLLQTIDLIQRLPAPFFLQAYNLVFIPGTMLFNRACQDGVIDGIDDSGYELDFLAGLNYKAHRWKGKNLYLNSLIFAMAGKSTRFRLGFLPRTVLPILLNRKFIDFNDRYRALSKANIVMAKFFLRTRRKASRLVIRLLKDPRSLYIIKHVMQRFTASRPRNQ